METTADWTTNTLESLQNPYSLIILKKSVLNPSMTCVVQVRMCPKHALQLNYRKNKELLKAEMRSAKKRRRSGGEGQGGEGGSAGEDGPEEDIKKHHSMNERYDFLAVLLYCFLQLYLCIDRSISNG